MLLFERIRYHVSESIPEYTRGEIGRILQANGATDVPVDRATHVISDTVDFEGANALKHDSACVTPYWVERSMELGTLQDPKYFSADKELIFSGIVASSAGIPSGDKEVIIAGIKECGGQWREGLTRDVTHLFVTNSASQKYETAMHFRDSAHITILLPQWFDQCWSMQMRLPTDVFEFPDPPYMRKDHDVASYKAQMLMYKSAVDGHDKRAVLRSMKNMDIPLPSSETTPPVPTRNIWQKRAILLSFSPPLDPQLRESVEARIRRHGGIVVDSHAGDKDAMAALDRADVLITQYRNGPVYARALAEGKIIGTLAWLFYVERSGVVSSPRDQLLHYPVRSRPIEGFEHHEITITNYQGEERDYLKKLIELMGAKFTPTMSGRNTIVIAAYRGGNKTSKADEWSVPIVTHKWLEDCFVEWRNLTPAQKKYLDYAPGVNYGTVLGERGVGRIGLEEDPDLPPEKEMSLPDKNTSVPEKSKDTTNAHSQKSGQKTRSPNATASSALDALEVEDDLDTEEVDLGLSNKVDDASKPAKEVTVKIGPPRSTKKTGAKSGVPSPEVISPRVSNQQQEEEEEESEKSFPEGTTPPMKAGPSRGIEKTSAKSNLQPPQASNYEEEEKEKSSLEEITTPMKVGPPRGAKKTGTTSNLTTPVKIVSPPGPNDANEEEVVPKSRKKLKRRLEKGKTAVTYGTDEEVRDGGDILSPHFTSKHTPRTYRSKARTRAQGTASKVPESESEGDIHQSPIRKVGSARESKDADVAVRKRLARSGSEIPEAHDVLDSVTSRSRGVERKGPGASPAKSSPVPLSPKTLPRTTSIRAVAREAVSVTVEKPKRDRPRVRGDTDALRSSSPPHRTASSKLAGASSVHSSVSPSRTPANLRSPLRRSAAIAASQKLRDEVMPDVMNYEREMKKGWSAVHKRKRSMEGVRDDEEERSDNDGEVVKKQKLGDDAKVKGKGTTKANDREKLDGPHVKIVTTQARNTKRRASTEDEDASSNEVRRKKGRSESLISEDDRPRLSSCDPKQIRILTTKVTVEEEILKRLSKLGVRFTEKPAQCTHLVANSFARTEKFLCALPNAPFVLNVSWLLESSARKEILAEDDHILKDPQMEQKHNFKLAEVLGRARDLKKKKEKLLQGRFFYFTPNVRVDFGLMKNVIQTNGAECIQKTPTTRNLSSTRHVISSEKDEKLWRPLANQGIPIYSHEFILTAACTQFVDWDDMDKRVPGSF